MEFMTGGISINILRIIIFKDKAVIHNYNK